MNARARAARPLASVAFPEIRGAIEALDQGFALFDADDRLGLCNARFRRTHADFQDLLEPGLPWGVFLAEARRRELGEGYERLDEHLVAGAESPLSFELSGRGRRWMRLGLHPTEDGGFVVTETDVTDAHTAAEARAEAESLLARIIDASPVTLMIYDLDAEAFVHWTPEWERQLGPREDIREVWVDRNDRADFLTDLLAAGRVDDFEAVLKDRDDKPFPAHISACVLEHEGRKISVATMQDMTRIYAQRDEISRGRQRLEDAIEALDQGFALFDREHRLLMANRRFLDVNYEIADALSPGTTNADMLAAAAARNLQPLAVGWPEAGREPVDAAYEFGFRDGRSFEASRRGTTDGGFLLVWRDVTAEKAAEAELSRRREASYQTEKLSALGELLAGVAHELNNPLSIVVGQALMMREDVEDPGLARRIEKISAAAERCAKIVKTFLAMARQKPARMEAVSLNGIIETALDVTAYGLRGAGAQVEAQLAEDLPDVLADEDQIAQVFVNLITNAEHALAETGPEARIALCTRFDHARGEVLAQVADNGPGVPPDLRARIFEPFFTTKGVGDGTGVGLALSHRILLAHGGGLEVGEAPGGGALFTVSLPVAQRAASPGVVMDRSAPPPGLTALVVEDEAEIGEMLADMLRATGVAPTHTRSAEDGLKLIEAGARFDMILSDLTMPGMGGRGLLAELEARHPDLVPRLAFVTGDAMSADAEAIRTAASLPLLEKPVAPGELRRLVRKLARLDS